MSRSGIATAVSFALAVVAWQIPAWWSNGQRRAQDETDANLRSLGMALDAYGQDHRSSPLAAGCLDLQRALVPTYVKAETFPRLCHDGWGHPLAYNYSREGSITSPAFVLASPGRDGVLSASTRDLFMRRGAPVLRSELAKELSRIGTWYDMDQVWTPRGPVALAFDGQEARYDYGRAAPWTKWVRWVVVLVGCVMMALFIRADFTS
ncbi:MAG TPA: hypothetical protein VKB93_22545 [Thermoanaerobaculia bacterium]|nr:hypothetical protein [Thermoanaerobaculia bacterium]